MLATENNSNVKISLTHLERLEAESIHILREVAVEAAKQVMLYSLSKHIDWSPMVHSQQDIYLSDLLFCHKSRAQQLLKLVPAAITK